MGLKGNTTDSSYSCGQGRSEQGGLRAYLYTWKFTLLGRIRSFLPRGYPNGSDVPLCLGGRYPFCLHIRTLGKESEMVNVKLELG